MAKKIAITTTSFAEYESAPLDLLEENDFEVVKNNLGHKLDKKKTLELGKGCIGIVAGTETYSRDILEKLVGLKVISRCGVGIENIDINCAKDFGIKVMSTPDAPTLAVAELTLGLMLDLLRKISLMDRNLHHRKWQKVTGTLLSGKKIGIVGFGRIARKLAELLRPFNCKIAYADPFVEDNLLGFKRLSLLELLPWADIITMHVSNKDTVIGEKEIRQMKKGACLVNTSRGSVIDEDALYKALRDGDLSGAALDVFSEEPYQGHLGELDNIVLTPHIGSYAKEARIEMEKEAVKNLLKGLEVIK